MRRPRERFLPNAADGALMAHPDRLGRALGHNGSLRFKCRDCGHEGAMPGDVALAAFGELAMPSEVRNRLRCSKCGSKSCEIHL